MQSAGCKFSLRSVENGVRTSVPRLIWIPLSADIRDFAPTLRQSHRFPISILCWKHQSMLSILTPRRHAFGSAWPDTRAAGSGQVSETNSGRCHVVSSRTNCPQTAFASPHHSVALAQQGATSIHGHWMALESIDSEAATPTFAER